MGKSPGKWIKSFIFRKKSSTSRKYTFQKKIETEKEASITSETSLCDWAMNASITHDVEHYTSYTHGENSNSGLSFLLPHEALVSSHQNFGIVDMEKSICLSSTDSAEIARQDEAAIKAQAIFRGYLARRAFRTLKGIIRLQALVRGHLVRRQAVATLHCMQGIVRLQTLFRDRKVRLLDVGPKVHNSCRVVELSDLFATTRQDKLLSIAFACKLLASSTTAIPLHLHYDSIEPNSAWNWLERWSSFHFCEPLTQLQKVPISKSHTKQDEIQGNKTELGMPNQVERSLPAEDGGKNSPQSTLTDETLMHNMRRAHEDDQQNELDKVEQNLRIIAETKTLALDPSSFFPEKPTLSPIMMTSSAIVYASEKDVGKSFENTSEPSDTVSKSSVQFGVLEAPKTLIMEERVNVPQDDHVSFQQHEPIKSRDIENVTLADEEHSNKEEKTTKDWNRGKRKSLPVKIENSEIFSQNSPPLPHYMAATESAKAKLKGLGSHKFGQDCTENDSMRRALLPSYNSCKLSSKSPIMQRPSNFDRSLLSSTDGHGKGARPEWRR